MSRKFFDHPFAKDWCFHRVMKHVESDQAGIQVAVVSGTKRSTVFAIALQYRVYGRLEPPTLKETLLEYDGEPQSTL